MNPAVPAFGVLPGEFAIRTYLKNTYLTARDGGRHSFDAVITAATTLGPNEKFKLTTIQPDYTTIQTPQGYYISAVGGGGLGGDFSASEVLQTERTSIADDALFVLFGPGVGGNSTIRTFNEHFLTALGGGGKTTGAFHTDATVANTWEDFWVLKSGDLGSGYRYAIRPAGTGGPGEVVNFLTAIGGGGRGANNYPAITHFSGLFSDSQFTLIQLTDGSYALQTPSGNYVTAVGGGGSPMVITSIPMLRRSKPGRSSKSSTRGTRHTPFRPSAAFTSPSTQQCCKPREASRHGSVSPMRPRRSGIRPNSN